MTLTPKDRTLLLVGVLGWMVILAGAGCGKGDEPAPEGTATLVEITPTVEAAPDTWSGTSQWQPSSETVQPTKTKKNFTGKRPRIPHT